MWWCLPSECKPNQARASLAKLLLSNTCMCCLQEPNIRYLALENLTRLALVPEVLESIRPHQVSAACANFGCCTCCEKWCRCVTPHVLPCTMLSVGAVAVRC
jgi:hypothetical protein